MQQIASHLQSTSHSLTNGSAQSMAHSLTNGSAQKVLTRTWRLLIAIAMILPAITFAPAARAEEGVHVVAQGESLGYIAQQYGLTTYELVSGNGLSNPNVIVPGQRLIIPGLAAESTAENPAERITAAKALPSGDGYYTVQRGDTLSQIAQINGLSLSDVKRLNGLTNENFLWVGQKLRVTARVAPVPLEEDDVELALAESIYVVQQADTLETIAKEHSTTVQALLNANGLPHENFIWAGQRLRIQAGPKPAPSPALNSPNSGGYRMIEINLSAQTLTAWEGDSVVMHTYISSGTSATPTVTGRFNIGHKLTSQRMIGPGYDLPGVPWVMYFYGAYAIHGAYWHSNFGTPMSHGCVNMSISDAQALYQWASYGTEVYVHY